MKQNMKDKIPTINYECRFCDSNTFEEHTLPSPRNCKEIKHYICCGCRRYITGTALKAILNPDKVTIGIPRE